MTIGNQTVKTDVICDGVSFIHNNDFLVPEDGSTALYLTDPSDGTQTEIAPNAYTVANEGDPDGGTFIYPLSGDAITASWVLTLIRTTPYTQTANLNNQGAYYPEAVEGGLDWLAQQTQQLDEKAGRSLKVPVSEGPIGDLPALEARKGMVLGFNEATGEPEAVTNGSVGPAGADGFSFLSGDGAPSNSLGNDGDSYVDVDPNGDGTTYDKSGGVWVDNGGSLKGPPGETTVTGGVMGPVSSTIGNIATWSDTAGSAVADSGVAVSNVVLLGGAQTIAGAKTFSDAVTVDNDLAVTGGATIEGDLYAAQTGAYSDDGGASAGPYLVALRDSGSPAANDAIGATQLQGKDSAGAYRVYAQAGGYIVNPTASIAAGGWELGVLVGGSYAGQLRVENGVYAVGATGGAQGAGTFNATGYYVNGSPLSSGGYEGKIQTATYGTNNTISSSMPVGSSAPTNSQGTEVITLAFTPNNASSRLFIQAVVHFRTDCAVTANSTGTVSGVVALFVDSTTNALQSSVGCSTGGRALSEDTWTYYAENTVVLEYEVSAASTSARTYKIRVGKATAGSLVSSTLEINDGSMGGTKVSRLTVTEIPPET